MAFASCGVTINTGVFAVSASLSRFAGRSFNTSSGFNKHAGGPHDVVAGTVIRHKIVAKFERELATAEILFVLPAGGVGVGRQPRKPLGNLVNVVAVVLKYSYPVRPPPICALLIR